MYKPEAPDTVQKLHVPGRIDVMKIVPKLDLLIVETVPEKEISDGGIFIPETARERPIIGKVLRAGPGKPRKGGTDLIPMQCAVGEYVLFSPYANMEVILDPIQGKQYKVIHDDHIIGTIDKEDLES